MWLAGCAVVVLATACSGGSAATSSGQELEKTEITVGIMPINGTAPLFLAKKRGFFRQEGLQVETRIVAGGAAGLPKVKGGALDITYSNYVSMFQALSNGGIELRVLADGYNATEGTLALMVPGESEIRQPADLEGKTISVNTLNNQAELLTRSVLRTHRVPQDSVEFTAVPFPETPAVLARADRGEVDASFLVEPFITQVQMRQGARMVADIGTGPTKGWPTAGWATTSEFVEKHPKTAAAFTRAMQRGAAVADERNAVEKILPTYTKIKPKTAAVINLGTYPTTVEEKRIQRVADLMYEFGLLDQRINAATLIPDTMQ